MTVLRPFQKKSSELKVTSPRPGSAGTNYVPFDVILMKHSGPGDNIRRMVEPVSAVRLSRFGWVVS